MRAISDDGSGRERTRAVTKIAHAGIAVIGASLAAAGETVLGYSIGIGAVLIVVALSFKAVD